MDSIKITTYGGFVGEFESNFKLIGVRILLTENKGLNKIFKMNFWGASDINISCIYIYYGRKIYPLN